jgi:hypothetical protein
MVSGQYQPHVPWENSSISCTHHGVSSTTRYCVHVYANETREQSRHWHGRYSFSAFRREDCNSHLIVFVITPCIYIACTGNGNCIHKKTVWRWKVTFGHIAFSHLCALLHMIHQPHVSEQAPRYSLVQSYLLSRGDPSLPFLLGPMKTCTPHLEGQYVRICMLPIPPFQKQPFYLLGPKHVLYECNPKLPWNDHIFGMPVMHI